MSAGCGWTSYVSGFRDPGNDRGEAPSARFRADGVARPTDRGKFVAGTVSKLELENFDSQYEASS